MDTDVGKRLSSIVKTYVLQGKRAAVVETQRHLIPHILKVFAEHDEETVYKFIVTDYPLVEERLPDSVKNALHNLAQNGQLRPVYQGWVMEYVTPENILTWMRNPDEWLDAEDAEDQRMNLRLCAATIEETEGGRAWLEEQVMEIYHYADIVPKDSTPEAAKEGA